MEDGAFDNDFDLSKTLVPELDPVALADELSRLSDEDLAELEDDLEFCSGTGVPSFQILSLLTRMVELDRGWQRLLDWKVRTRN